MAPPPSADPANPADPADASLAEAVVICTRNRPADVRRTLASVAASDGAAGRLVLVVDASDPAPRHANADAVAAHAARSLPFRHHCYARPPASTGQRNAGVDALPPAVGIVHFVDDDVTVEAGYFARLAATLRAHPRLGGVGGVIVEPGRATAPTASPWRRAFLIESADAGRVLPSGHATSAQHPAADAGPHAPSLVPLPGAAGAAGALVQTAWLSGCSCTFRRRLLAQHRFDEALTGYALHEDLDLSYRLGQAAPLAVDRRARLVHHRSPRNRYAAERHAATSAVHRYWFVRKNGTHPLGTGPFWWSVLGQTLARLAARHPDSGAALRGLWTGVRAIARRRHPLLHAA